MIFSCTLFFYYNVIKSVGAVAAPVLITLVVHYGQSRRIIPESVLSRIHLHITSECQVGGDGCGYVLTGGLGAFKRDNRFAVALRILFKLALSWFHHRLVH